MAFVRKATGEGRRSRLARGRSTWRATPWRCAARLESAVPTAFAETKLRWTYRFRDGLIDEINWQPRAGD